MRFQPHLLLSSFLISLLAILVVVDGKAPPWQGCKAPSVLTDFNWDQSEVSTGGYFFPMSSIADRRVEGLMLGPDARKCVRMRWSDECVTVNIFYGVGGTHEAYFRCTQSQVPKNMWECEHLRAKTAEGPDLSHTAWVTLTDNKTYSFTVRCFPSIQQQGWVLFTTKPYVSARLKKKVLDHAGSLGFSAFDVYTRPYNTCAPVCLQ